MDRIEEYIKAKGQQAVELLRLLVENKALSPENGGAGEMKKALALEEKLRSLGLNDIKYYNALDPRVGTRPNIVVTIPGAIPEAPAFWVISHLDVVPSGDEGEWEYSPWKLTVSGDKLIGRGAEDNGQGLCSSIIAALAIKELKIEHKHTIKLLFCADEECGSRYGVGYLLQNEKLFSFDDIIIIPDGGDSEGVTIEVAEKNVLWLSFLATGVQGHGSRPDEAKNALMACVALASSIARLKDVLCARDELFTPPYSTVTPTMMSASSEGYNVIPGKAKLGVDMRLLPIYTVDKVLELCREKAREVERDYGVKVKIQVINKSESPATKKDSPCVALLSSAIKASCKKDCRIVGIGGGTVAAEFRRAGYGNCAVWSTLLEKAHAVNEYCLLSNLLADAKTLAYAMKSY